MVHVGDEMWYYSTQILSCPSPHFLRTMTAEPHPTLYIKNIDWKVKIPLLKRALYSLFTRYGKVLDVVALRRDKLRGQAWIVYAQASSATTALQTCQGFHLFGKDLIIEYARRKSDMIAKKDGSFVPKHKRKAEEENESSTKKQKVEASKILLAHNLPPQVNETTLDVLFRPYQATVAVTDGTATIVFQDLAMAAQAKKTLQGYAVSAGNELQLEYGDES